MKKITIDGKEYEIDCNAFTQVLYNRFFKTGIFKDMQVIKEYLIKQTLLSEKLSKQNLTDEQRIAQVSDIMVDDIDDFIQKVTQMAWILIYTANDKIEDYETWLKSIKKFKIDDDWIVEVTEYAVDCFC